MECKNDKKIYQEIYDIAEEIDSKCSQLKAIIKKLKNEASLEEDNSTIDADKSTNENESINDMISREKFIFKDRMHNYKKSINDFKSKFLDFDKNEFVDYKVKKFPSTSDTKESLWTSTNDVNATDLDTQNQGKIASDVDITKKYLKYKYKQTLNKGEYSMKDYNVKKGCDLCSIF